MAEVSLVIKPGGCSMYTSSVKEPWRKAFEISNCRMGQSKETAKARRSLIVVGLITGLKVSV